MACNTTPASRAVPSCGASAVTLTKTSSVPEGVYIPVPYTVEYTLSFYLGQDTPIGGITILDTFTNEVTPPATLTLLSPGWSLSGPVGDDYTITSTQANVSGFYSIRLQAEISSPVAQGLLNNEAALLTPVVSSSSSVDTHLALTVTNNMPDTLRVGEVVNFQYTTANGSGLGVTFTLISGDLPDGLTLSPTGQITGTVTSADDSSFIIQATDANGSVVTILEDTTIDVLHIEMGGDDGAEPANLTLNSITLT